MTAIYPGHENYDEVMLAARNEYLLWLNRNHKHGNDVAEFTEELVADDEMLYTEDEELLPLM